MVRPKKHLGQHFLNDGNIARKIVSQLKHSTVVCELGPGTGILTTELLNNPSLGRLTLIEIDEESVEFLKGAYTDERLTIVEEDFLRVDLGSLFDKPFALIGNFPYNISSQILFKVLANRQKISEVVCMIQKEVAERIVAPPGSKTYGILSVLIQTWFDVEYCFTVNENVFTPPPKVKSAVIRLEPSQDVPLIEDDSFFIRVVKTAFNQRRKKLRNALSPMMPDARSEIPYPDSRAEQLTKHQFAELTSVLLKHSRKS